MEQTKVGYALGSWVFNFETSTHILAQPLAGVSWEWIAYCTCICRGLRLP